MFSLRPFSFMNNLERERVKCHKYRIIRISSLHWYMNVFHNTVESDDDMPLGKKSKMYVICKI